MGSSTSISSLNRSDIPNDSVRFLNFQLLKSCGTFPRYPEDEDLTSDLEQIKRDESLLIFISHTWLRATSRCAGFDGNPHPDNLNGDMFKLCVSGIERIMRDLAPGMKECFVWVDYSCINQEFFPVAEILQLHRIMEACDLMFTPIPGGSANWDVSSTSTQFLDVYQASQWKEGDSAYLNRAWCRTEMYYSANIPVKGNINSKVKRHSLFKGALAQHCENGRRPHLVYGNRERSLKILPIIFPPMLSSFYANYDPLLGSLSKDTDRQHIEQLMHILVPFLEKNKAVVGYSGDTNDFGQKHGQGSLIYTNGDIYDGQFQKNKRHGQGVLRSLNGEVYKGEFKDGCKNGRGVLKYKDGSKYDGDWLHDKFHGRGTYSYVSGDKYKGDYVDGNMHGAGVFTYANGDVYSGEFKGHLRNGKGKLVLASGQVSFEGIWMNDKRC